MGCRGVHFALTAGQAARLMDTPGSDDETLMAFVVDIEEAWGAIHRCLTVGKLEYGGTLYHKCILGSDNLYEGGDDMISLLEPNEVKEVAAAVKDVDQEELLRRYRWAAPGSSWRRRPAATR